MPAFPDPRPDEIAERIANRTEQERDPHPQLVVVRNLIQKSTGLSRSVAARICNGLSARQCDAVIKAKADDKAIRRVVETNSPAN